MEILPIFIQSEPYGGLIPLLACIGSVCGAYLLAHQISRHLRRVLRQRGGVEARPTRVGQVAAWFRAFLAITAPASSAIAVQITHKTRLNPPWFETSGFPPPRPLVRAGATIDSPTTTMPSGKPMASKASRPIGHPSIHGLKNDGWTRPLFPRWIPEHKEESTRGSEASSKERRAPSHYAVLPGDTLWGIAAKVLQTDDLRRIARYWPRIHRVNRDIIGSNPDLIRPGQVLSLPRDEA